MTTLNKYQTGGATLTHEIPDYLVGAIEKIENLDELLAAFLREQAAHEARRCERYSEEVRQLVKEAVEKGREIKENESREATAKAFMAEWEKIQTHSAG